MWVCGRSHGLRVIICDGSIMICAAMCVPVRPYDP